MTELNLIVYKGPNKPRYGIQIDNIVVTTITPDGVSYESLPNQFFVERSLLSGDKKKDKLIGHFVHSNVYGHECSGIVSGINHRLGIAYLIGTLDVQIGRLCVYSVPLKHITE